MIELKPCPFCGGEAVVDKYPVRGYEPAISFEVRCSKCGQRRVGSYVDSVYKSERWARRKAIEVWNERPNPWHTGTPTNLECKYLCKIKGDGETYAVMTWNGVWWRVCATTKQIPEDYVIEWQKIKP